MYFLPFLLEDAWFFWNWRNVDDNCSKNATKNNCSLTVIKATWTFSFKRTVISKDLFLILIFFTFSFTFSFSQQIQSLNKYLFSLAILFQIPIREEVQLYVFVLFVFPNYIALNKNKHQGSSIEEITLLKVLALTQLLSCLKFKERTCQQVRGATPLQDTTVSPLKLELQCSTHNWVCH